MGVAFFVLETTDLFDRGGSYSYLTEELRANSFYRKVIQVRLMRQVIRGGNKLLTTLNSGFQFLIGLGGAALTSIFIIVISLIIGVKLSKSLEGGLRIGIALAGMSAIISLLTNEFGPSLKAFSQRTGSALDIVDLGWAQMAVITWGSIYTMGFAVICVLINLFMLFFKKTNTMNVDLFNVWHLSIIGMLVLYYTNNNFLIAVLFVGVIYIMMLINADLMKPKLNELLSYSDTTVTATAHPSFLLNPLVMFLNTIIDKLFPFIDRFDFNAQQLNKKVGFWGSSFAVGIYLGVFIGVLGQESVAKIVSMAFIGAVCLELFGVIGGWFGPAMEPISDGIIDRMHKRNSRKLNVGVDWSIVAVRPEIWAVANIIAPILMVVAIFLPGNRTLPLGGIIMTALVPSLLFVTGGKVIRMSIMGAILTPLYLWASTAIADFMTSTSVQLDVFPKGLSKNSLFTSIEAIPMEKIMTVLFGETYKNPNIKGVFVLVALIVVYFGLFYWYRKKMQKENLTRKELEK